jgi:hypothetical protein
MSDLPSGKEILAPATASVVDGFSDNYGEHRSNVVVRVLFATIIRLTEPILADTDIESPAENSCPTIRMTEL